MTRRALVWTHDITGAQSGVIGRDFRELYTDTTLDQDERLVFQIPADHPKAYLLAENIELRLGGRTFYVAEFVQERRGTETIVRVEAPAIWQRLGNVDYPGSLVITDKSAAEGGGDILEESGWTVGARSVGTGTFSMETQDRSILANVRTWAKITGTFVEFDTQARTVDWLAARGNDIGLAFRKGRNLRNVVRRRTLPKVTVLYPYGRDDLTIAGVNGGNEFVEDLTFYTSQGVSEADARTPRYAARRVIRDQSFVKEADLLAWAQSELVGKAQPIQQVELDVVDISEISGVRENIEVGDRTRAFDPDFDEEFAAVVTRFKRYPLQPWRNAIELSTSPAVIDDPDTSAGRPLQSDEWIQFVGPVMASFQIRNDATWTVGRIPLRFRAGGRANVHIDLEMTGVGTGGLVDVEIYDGESDSTIKAWPALAYSDGETSRIAGNFAIENLEGSYDLRLRVTVNTTGGADPSAGVNLTVESEDSDPLSFWVLAQGAVQETPSTGSTSVTVDFGTTYPDDVYLWTVPDNVTEVTVLAKGGGSNTSGGGTVQATLPVTPGEVLAVAAGRRSGSGAGNLTGEGGRNFPNGGALGGPSGNRTNAGGGASWVARNWSPSMSQAAIALSDILVIAPGAGGDQDGKSGGAGGFFTGADGSALPKAGAGASQYGGGAGGQGDADNDGGTGSYMFGGRSATGTSSFDKYGAGGGGGLYGGGGAGRGDPIGASAGGGSGWVHEDAYDLIINDGVNVDHGQVVISWSEAV